MRISDWSSDVCSSDLLILPMAAREAALQRLTSAARSVKAFVQCSIGGGWREVGMSSKFKDLRHEAGVPALLADARRIVVKIGSSLLIGESDGAARRHWLETVAAAVAALAHRGKPVASVSPAAAALGRGSPGPKRAAT